MQRNSRPPSKLRELAPEQKAAEQEHRLANKNGGKYQIMRELADAGVRAGQYGEKDGAERRTNAAEKGGSRIGK